MAKEGDELNQGSLLIKERVVSVFRFIKIYGQIVNGKK